MVSLPRSGWSGRPRFGVLVSKPVITHSVLSEKRMEVKLKERLKILTQIVQFN